jgi:hypothetical protein
MKASATYERSSASRRNRIVFMVPRRATRD